MKQTKKINGKVYTIVSFAKTKAIADAYVKRNMKSSLESNRLYGWDNKQYYKVYKLDSDMYVIYSHRKKGKKFLKELNNLPF